MQTDLRLYTATTYDTVWTRVYEPGDLVRYEHLQAVFLQVWAPVEEAQRKLEQASDPGD